MSLLTPLMTKQQLCAELGISDIALRAYRVKYSNMPKPIKLGQKLYWRRDDVENWLRAFLPSEKTKNGNAAS